MVILAKVWIHHYNKVTRALGPLSKLTVKNVILRRNQGFKKRDFMKSANIADYLHFHDISCRGGGSTGAFAPVNFQQRMHYTCPKRTFMMQKMWFNFKFWGCGITPLDLKSDAPVLWGPWHHPLFEWGFRNEKIL